MQTLASRYDHLRHRLEDGEQTTVYVVRHSRSQTRLTIRHFPVPQQLDRWCREGGIREAIVGGFFVRPSGPPLGEVWIGGRRVETEPVLGPYDGPRAAVYVHEADVRIGPRTDLPRRPPGHLLQAGPMLVRDGTPLVDPHDREGFVAGAHQFDSDITRGRHPRAALGTSDDDLIALVCDGRRTGVDAGLTLAELGELMAGLGARQAINLDGGGSTALIHRGHLLNRPYDAQDQPSGNARAVATAAVFDSSAAR
jgi:phosphodiester glycosidase